MTSEMHCIGCGVKLQTTDETQPGYIPKIAKKDDILCRRCFKLRHYNTNEPVALESEDYQNMVSQIRGTNSLVVHVIDLFDVDGTLLKNLPRLIGNNPVVLVANKIDLLPKSTSRKRLKDWLYRVANEAGLKVSDIILISAVKGEAMDLVAKKMEALRQGKDIYVVGVTNVGKSTFINQFIQRSTGIKEAITTSYFPGTTLGFIHIPLDEQNALIDTPGIINDQQLAHFVSKKDLKKIIPHKEIKPRNFQLNHDQTLFIGGFVRMDFIKGDKQTFVCYFANDIPIHRTKLQNADELYEKHVGQLLAPPHEETLKTLPKMTRNSYKITKAYTDIVISGLGWITILSDHVTVDIHCPKGVAVLLRDSFKSQ